MEEYQQIYHEVVDDMLRVFGQIFITFFTSLKNLTCSINKLFNHIYDYYCLICVFSTPHRYKSGRVRPYSLQLGRSIEQKLWERLDRPMITTSAEEDGRLVVDISYWAAVYPPFYDIHNFREPEPGPPQKKRTKN